MAMVLPIYIAKVLDLNEQIDITIKMW